MITISKLKIWIVIMPKSDHTRYASEIPTLLAWDSEYSHADLDRAVLIANSTHSKEFDKNRSLAQEHKILILNHLNELGMKPPTQFRWAANNNRDHNGSPSDVQFVNHILGGISVKANSDIIGNFGTQDFGRGTNKPRGEDLFRHLAPIEYDALILRIKQNLIAELSVGDTWTEDREINRGKYAITRISKNEFRLKFGSTNKTLTMEEFLTEIVSDRNGQIKRLPGKWRRVIGNYYQDNKKNYVQERLALFNKLYPMIENLCKQNVISDPNKLCQMGGFTEKPYYVSDLYNNRIYYVPSKSQVLNNIQVEIYNKDKERSFGSGFELGCKIKLMNSPEFSNLDFYVCYNRGTFNGGPVIKIQGFKNKEKLWQRIL